MLYIKEFEFYLISHFFLFLLIFGKFFRFFHFIFSIFWKILGIFRIFFERTHSIHHKKLFFFNHQRINFFNDIYSILHMGIMKFYSVLLFLLLITTINKVKAEVFRGDKKVLGLIIPFIDIQINRVKTNLNLWNLMP